MQYVYDFHGFNKNVSRPLAVPIVMQLNTKDRPFMAIRRKLLLLVLNLDDKHSFKN